METLPSRLEHERERHPTATDTERVRYIAADLIDELGIESAPVDVEMIASFLGITEVIPDPLLPEAGCLICDDRSKFQIRVRSTDSFGRQRFTICHECSHTFFPGFTHRTQYRCSPDVRSSDDEDLEALCDVAASELLFPRRLLARDISDTQFGLDSLEDIANLYQGSLEATGHSYVAAWPEPVALLVLTRRRKPRDRKGAPEKLRLDTAHPEGRWPYFLRHKSVDAGDVFDRALDGEIIAEATTVQGICADPVDAEVHARLYPLTVDGETRERVVALARQIRR